MNGDRNIDERLQAIAESIELLTHDIHAMQERTARWEEKTRALDERERKGRQAILAGIVAYLRIMEDGSNGEVEQ